MGAAFRGCRLRAKDRLAWHSGQCATKLVRPSTLQPEGAENVAPSVRAEGLLTLFLVASGAGSGTTRSWIRAALERLEINVVKVLAGQEQRPSAGNCQEEQRHDGLGSEARELRDEIGREPRMSPSQAFPIVRIDREVQKLKDLREALQRQRQAQRHRREMHLESRAHAMRSQRPFPPWHARIPLRASHTAGRQTSPRR
eukprot:scaffold7067_cov245-Pinguiococcus_pyrenoidosus.AAC.6